MSGQGTSTGSNGGLHPVVASTATALLDPFLEWIADAPADPFDPQVVVVPNIGMAEYLEGAIRARFGICANVEFLFPGRLRERSGVPAVWPWSVEETTWMVLAALEDLALAAACGLTARLEERPLAVARHIAELFDRYHSYRPGLIEAWRCAEFVDDLGGVTLDERFRWQYELLRVVDAANPRPEPAPRRLPDRIAMFGTAAPVGAQADLVHALAADLDITAFLLVPGPLPSALERWVEPAVAALSHFTGGSADRSADPARLPDLDLHLCFGPAREFDAARDAILDAFGGDPTLTARDVTVVAPAIARSAPLAAPILGAPLHDDHPDAPRRLPVRIADRVPSLTPGVASAIDQILVLAAGRCRATEMLEVLRLEPVAATFGIDRADERIGAWILDGLDVRWGLDGPHRGRWGYATDLAVGSWGPAIDRLLAGVLIQNPSDLAVTLDEHGDLIVPFDDVSGSEFELVGAVAAFVDAVRDLSERAAATPSLAGWADLLETVLARFIHDDPSTRAEINAARDLVAAMRGRAGAVTRPIAISEARTLIAGAFDDRMGSARNRFDAIAIGGPRARRGVPHRITALVGLDDDATRSGTVSGDDILAATHADHPWEADRSEEARLAILDALLAADRAIVTTTARDVVTNRSLGLPVVVEELADAIPALRGALDGAPTIGASVVEHRRRLADDPTFDPAGPAWARALATAPRRLPPEPIIRPDAPSLSLRDLTAPYRNAHELFLRDGLEAALPPDTGARDEEVDLAIGPLQRSVLAGNLVDHLAEGGDAIEWRVAVQARGSLPPLLLGDRAMAHLVGEVEAIVTEVGGTVRPTDRVRVHRTVGSGSAAIDVDLELDVVGEAIVRVHSTRLQARHLIEPWVALALLHLEHPETAWTARIGGLIERSERKIERTFPTARVISLRPGAADGVLEHILGLRALARAMPIALFPRATTRLALGSIRVGARDDVGWKIEEPDHLDTSFENQLESDLRRGATAWFFGGATADTLSMEVCTEAERAALGRRADERDGPALAYARHLHAAFTDTAAIAKFTGGGA